MIRSILIGLVAGARTLTPLAAVAETARRGGLPGGGRASAWLAHPAVAAGLKALAAGEFVGDLAPSAPDRTVPVALAARMVSGAIAGAVLAPRRRQVAGAVLGGAAAVAGAYITLAARERAVRWFGPRRAGLVEDALAVTAAALLASRADGGRA